jgi:hypothetical protein
MLMHRSSFPYLSSALVVCALIASPLVKAQCCPSGGVGTPTSTTGLGQSIPIATDVAIDPSWQVYEFERDGVRYVQINDQSGTVRAAAGRIDGIFWVLPIGSDADRVSLPGQPAPSIQGRTLYRSNDVEVVLYRSSDGDRWMIQTPDASQ